MKILIQTKATSLFHKIPLSRKNCDIKKLLITAFLHCLVGTFGKSKFEDLWKIVLAGVKPESEIIRNNQK